jgi:hypothetical protein
VRCDGNNYNEMIMRLLRCAVPLLIGFLLLPATAQAQGTPFALQEVVEMLNANLSSAQILRTIGTACLTFRVNSAEADLRRAKADDALITGLRAKCYAAPPERAAPQARGIVSIIGPLPAGWSRVVNELPPSTNRQIDLTPGRQATIMVMAPGWCPDRTQVTMTAGDTVRWTPTLRGKPWVGGC